MLTISVFFAIKNPYFSVFVKNLMNNTLINGSLFNHTERVLCFHCNLFPLEWLFPLYESYHCVSNIHKEEKYQCSYWLGHTMLEQSIIYVFLWCIKRKLLFLNDIGWTSNILSFFLILAELIPLWRLAYLLFFRKNEEKLSHEI